MFDPYHRAYSHFMLLKVKIDLKVYEQADEVFDAMKTCIKSMKIAQEQYKKSADKYAKSYDEGFDGLINDGVFN